MPPLSRQALRSALAIARTGIQSPRGTQAFRVGRGMGDIQPHRGRAPAQEHLRDRLPGGAPLWENSSAGARGAADAVGPRTGDLNSIGRDDDRIANRADHEARRMPNRTQVRGAL